MVVVEPRNRRTALLLFIYTINLSRRDGLIVLRSNFISMDVEGVHAPGLSSCECDMQMRRRMETTRMMMTIRVIRPPIGHNLHWKATTWSIYICRVGAASTAAWSHLQRDM